MVFERKKRLSFLKAISKNIIDDQSEIDAKKKAFEEERAKWGQKRKNPPKCQ